MAPFAIRPCSIRDAAEIAANNMEAFWTDPVFVFSRRGQTLDQTTAQKVLRAPKQLITERHRRRHLKVVDEQSQALVGYARWILPEIEGVADLWGEAKLPAATEEEERRAEEQFGFSKWTVVGQASDTEDPITDARDRLLKDGSNLVSVGLLSCRLWHSSRAGAVAQMRRALTENCASKNMSRP